ncbi:MAG: hypothetical protein COB26_02085 [Piscirickettsiaceae bacterium]|nr:MAG: hypothetical protein COB89_03685 [Piscirickettsiaceae bacterium]PCI70877.1 MAG: hypothetical protein COB26_02085 [Piscirickettsiaceae bacterium]
MERYLMFYRLVSLLLFFVFLSGCVLTDNTRKSALNLPPLELQGGSIEVIAVGILDDRPYVVSGEKPAKYIGQFQLTMGDPYDAFTSSKQPMAKEFLATLPQLLKKQFPKIKIVQLDVGLSKAEAVNALLEQGVDKVVLITLKEWKSLTAIDTSLWFDAQLETFNAKKQLLAYKRTQGHDTFGGAAIAGPITNAKRTLPHAFRQKMQALFSDSMVMASLTSIQAQPIAVRAIDDVSEPSTTGLGVDSDLMKPRACTVELILYWKNAGMPDQEILSKCHSVKQ